MSVARDTGEEGSGSNQLWESKEYAETYNRELYPQIEKIMARFIEGIPVVKKFEAEYSTFHKVAFATTH